MTYQGAMDAILQDGIFCPVACRPQAVVDQATFWSLVQALGGEDTVTFRHGRMEAGTSDWYLRVG